MSQVVDKEVVMVLSRLEHTGAVEKIESSYVIKGQSADNFSDNYKPTYVYRYNGNHAAKPVENMTAYPCVRCPVGLLCWCRSIVICVSVCVCVDFIGSARRVLHARPRHQSRELRLSGAVHGYVLRIQMPISFD